MGFSPCCCSLQTGVKAIAIFEFVISGLLIILSSILLLAGASDEAKNDSTVLIMAGVIILIVCIVKILFAVLLWQAARDLNEQKARTWLIISGILFLINVITFIMAVSVNGGAGAPSAVGLVLEGYFIWVVWEFRKEIPHIPNMRYDGNENPAPQPPQQF